MVTLAIAAGIFSLPRSSSAYALINLNALSADTLEAQEEITVAADTPQAKAVPEEKVDKVEVRHKQKGALLALIPVTFDVTTIAYPTGVVEMRYPWWGAITLDNEKEIKTRIKVAVNNSLKASLVGSVKAEGEPKEPYFTRSQADAVEKEIRSILLESFQNWGKDGDE